MSICEGFFNFCINDIIFSLHLQLNLHGLLCVDALYFSRLYLLLSIDVQLDLHCLSTMFDEFLS